MNMNFPDRADVDGWIEPKELPSFARVRYQPEADAVADPGEQVREELNRLPLASPDQGATVAVGVESRGIHAIDDVNATVVAELDERGFDSVLVPAMGSHGGATPDGQREALDALGITEERVGAPIDARIDVERLDEVSVGDTSVPVYVGTAALDADGTVLINRMKPHTNFDGPIESGLAKMATVGLGKQRGAKAFHSTAIAEGYVRTIEAWLEVVERETTLLGGVALVENFHDETAHVEGVPAGSLRAREPELLERAYDEMATLPFDDLDLLVVDELGKDVFGAGMDTNVIGRYAC
jgi:hypothetical protein